MSLLPVTVPAGFTSFLARCILAGVAVASVQPFGPFARAGEPPGLPGEPEKAEAMLEKACARILDKVEGLEKQGKTEEAMAALQASPLGRVLEAWARIDRTLAEKEFEQLRNFMKEFWREGRDPREPEEALARIQAFRKTARNPVTLFWLEQVRGEMQEKRDSEKRVGKGQAFLREGADAIDLRKEKVLILPCDAYGFPGVQGEELLPPALHAGAVALFGSAGLSLEPFRAALDAAGLMLIYYGLPYGAYHVVDYHTCFDLVDGCGKGIEELPAA